MDAHKYKQIEMHKHLVEKYRRRVYDIPGAAAYYRYWNGELLKLLPQRQPLRVLDCGAGLAHLGYQAAQMGHESWAFDLSLEMLVAAEEAVRSRVGLIRADGERLPFKAASFDAAICVGWLHHMQNWEQAAKEIFRILKPGGRFIFSEPCDQNPLIKGIRKLMYVASPHFDPDDNGFTRRQMAEKFSDLGFRLTTMNYFAYTAYAFAGFPDKIPLVEWMKNGPKIVDRLSKFDEWLARVPGLRQFALQILACFEKP